MSATSSVTIRIPRSLKNRLEKLAESTSRDLGWHVARALDLYIEDQEWQIAEIRKGMAQIDAGLVVPHKKVARWLRSWGAKRELPPPSRASCR
jgi:RHH-type transcriptional regulator, rel operon repressor / antitoxin RelB